MPSVARGSMWTSPFLPLLVLCTLLALLHSVSALKCYDCLSKALPTCLDASKGEELDVTMCKPDEKFCSVLKMRDSQGQLVVSRQCAEGPDDAEKLLKLIGSVVLEKLEVESFNTCDTDECNASGRRGGGGATKAGATAPSSASTAAALLLTIGMAILLR